MEQYDVFVPVEGDPLRRTIDPRSGIVGEPEGDRIHIYYEGNRYGAVNMETYADRCYFAASRLAHTYPSIARAWIEPERLIRVGTFTFGHGVDVHDATMLVALAKWLDMFDADHPPYIATPFHDELRFKGVTGALA